MRHARSKNDAGVTQRNTRPPATLAQQIVRGVAAGFVATQVLDVLSMFFYENLTDEDRLSEDRARRGHQAYEKMVMAAAEMTGVHLTEEQIKFFGWKFHRAFGFAGGVQYMMLREKFAATKTGFGLAYGVAFYAIADEILIYLAKATPGPRNFNWKAHARGAIAHIGYGVACEIVAKSFDKVAEYEAGQGWALAEDLGKPRRPTDVDARSTRPRPRARVIAKAGPKSAKSANEH